MKMGETSNMGRTYASRGSNGHTYLLQPPHNSIWTPPRLQVNRKPSNGSDSPVISGSSASESSPSKNTFTDFFEEREGAGGMRVGRDFQAKIPTLLTSEEKRLAPEADKALLVWSPSERLTDYQVADYLNVAKDKFQYTAEQALGLLFWHKYDVVRALADLGNFTPNPEEWTLEDKVLFEQAFQFHGKAFDRIRQMLPDKSMSSLIRYYYKWKKLKCKTSVMDRQVKRFSQEDGDDQNSPPAHNAGNTSYHVLLQSSSHHHVSTSDSDSDDVLTTTAGVLCANCGVPGADMHSTTNKETLCKTCYLFWKKTGQHRPLTGPNRKIDRHVTGLTNVSQARSPPRGMYINHDDLQKLANADPQEENFIVQALDSEAQDLKCMIQETKQRLEALKQTLPKDRLESLKPDIPWMSNRASIRWSHEELLMAAQGIRRYGKDFKKIADVIGTKTETAVRTFYSNYRKRYDLDRLSHEYELEAEHLEQMMLDNNNEAAVEGPPISTRQTRRQV